MKERNGFVSNSSSSSFIMIGTEVTEDLRKKFFDGEEWSQLPKGVDFWSNYGNSVIGKYIQSVDTDEVLEMEIPFNKFKDMAEELSWLLEVDINKISLKSIPTEY